MPDPPRYAQVIVDVASANTDRVFTYRMPPGMALPPGTRVTVPFGRQTLEGVVLHLTDEPGIEESRIRDIIGALEDYPAVLPALVELAKEISAQSLCPLALSLRQAWRKDPAPAWPHWAFLFWAILLLPSVAPSAANLGVFSLRPTSCLPT